MSSHSASFAYSLALSQETSVLAIARRAYQIWEREGRPHGRDLAHWFEAESAIARELALAIANAPGAPRLVADRSVSRAASSDNAAAPGKDLYVWENTLENWNSTVATDVTAAFLCSREVLRRSMIERRTGVIINFSSSAGWRGMPRPPDGPIVGESSNGRTTDSDSVCLGSNPSSPATMKNAPGSPRGRFFWPRMWRKFRGIPASLPGFRGPSSL